ncbi:hypothetical protein JKP88DRAFT_240977 [Tribonema minus]|uniref:Uncharacterized protein n=1 Tax=Tribonema minus TaxID=303371 RepID=A0A835Z3K4_9STRA|nr:hypothetical protein JKP88DRAFT_240977 [Tribonema minus]
MFSSNVTTVYLLGEEHMNRHQCYKQGFDVNELLRSALLDTRYKVAVFIEMPQNYEEEHDLDVVCSVKPVNKPRKDVLNTIRSCLLRMRNSHDTSEDLRERINFTDIREFFGLLPYNEKEAKAVSCIKRQTKDMALGLVNFFFVHTIINAIKTLHGVDEEFKYLILGKPESSMVPYEAFVYENWHKSLVPLSKVLQKYFDSYTQSPGKCLKRIVDAYREIMDLFVDIYTTWRILRSFHNGIATHAIFYGGSSHSKNVSELLLSFGYMETAYYESPVDIACARAPRDFMKQIARVEI